ncbi:acyl-coenzyme A oxidase, peroxisomal-like [Benincasa hispida]|uniref:acyl-coenzyme A oxidase, peroxisomal-like n=1 Tax=Benincasa hispida TaxID=102211 RepID=UPI0019025A14|nr:acyl-coenzyme A oxidase, peroxisomal-like [Benincasa hispida]
MPCSRPSSLQLQVLKSLGWLCSQVRNQKEQRQILIDNVDYPGCYAMTVLHHGSNVQGLQTTTIFDPNTDVFIINTPNDGTIKWWIGNAAVHGKFAIVFAKLVLPTHDYKNGCPRIYCSDITLVNSHFVVGI